jgi:hypothetical protein
VQEAKHSAAGVLPNKSWKVNQDTSNVEEGCASSPVMVYLRSGLPSAQISLSRLCASRHGIDEICLTARPWASWLRSIRPRPRVSPGRSSWLPGSWCHETERRLSPNSPFSVSNSACRVHSRWTTSTKIVFMGQDVGQDLLRGMRDAFS